MEISRSMLLQNHSYNYGHKKKEKKDHRNYNYAANISWCPTQIPYHMMLKTVTQWVTLVEQELLTLREDLNFVGFMLCNL
jgi:hypothetical protein